MCIHAHSLKTLQLYRGLLRNLRQYPSSRREQLVDAVKQEFREKRDASGEALEKALWLGHMELKRLQTWQPTSKQMADGKDMHLQL